MHAYLILAVLDGEDSILAWSPWLTLTARVTTPVQSEPYQNIQDIEVVFICFQCLLGRLEVQARWEGVPAQRQILAVHESDLSEQLPIQTDIVL